MKKSQYRFFATFIVSRHTHTHTHNFSLYRQV